MIFEPHERLSKPQHTGFDPTACSGQEAIDLVEEIGVQRRLLDGMLGKAAKRVEDTAAYTYPKDRRTGRALRASGRRLPPARPNGRSRSRAPSSRCPRRMPRFGPVSCRLGRRS